jgi:hypothetical protein
MKPLVIAALLIGSQPAHAHCYSVWNYPTPQKCGSKIIAHRASEAKSWFVEITAVPAETTPLLPAPQPITPDSDQRTPEQIQDQQDHDQAVEARKADINRLMTILHAEEDKKTIGELQ